MVVRFSAQVTRLGSFKLAVSRIATEPDPRSLDLIFEQWTCFVMLHGHALRRSEPETVGDEVTGLADT